MTRLVKRSFQIARPIARYYSQNPECEGPHWKRGLVLGAYDGCAVGEYKFTAAGVKFDSSQGGRLSTLLKGSGVGLGHEMVVTNIGSEFYAIAISGLGMDSLGYNEIECLEEYKENIRVAAGVGAMALQDLGVQEIHLEAFTNAEAAAEGAALGVWRYQEMKNKMKQKTVSSVNLYDDPDAEGWTTGLIKAEAQNLARLLEECPANIMTPGQFVRTSIEMLCPCGVHVQARDKEWLFDKNFCAFLNMARGSPESPLFLELSYCGGAEEDKPVVLIGKGITYSSGGVCLKRMSDLAEFRAEMAGGAVIIGTLKALATLGVPVNVIGLIPLCENMPGGMATKPGDVVYSQSGKSIKIENTDKEGQVILADVLSFSKYFKPCLVTTIATLANPTRLALGSSASGAFSTSDEVWRELAKAGAQTGDRVWRLPIWKHFRHKIVGRYKDVDVANEALGPGGESCYAASFLMEFAPDVDFLHLDITGTGMCSQGIGTPYLRKGYMTGRPTRTLVQFLHQLACPQSGL